jgi:hypothetical protein
MRSIKPSIIDLVRAKTEICPTSLSNLERIAQVVITDESDATQLYVSGSGDNVL